MSTRAVTDAQRRAELAGLPESVTFAAACAKVEAYWAIEQSYWRVRRHLPDDLAVEFDTALREKAAAFLVFDEARRRLEEAQAAR